MFVCVSLACRRTEGEGLLATFAAAAVVVVGWWWPGAGGGGGRYFPLLHSKVVYAPASLPPLHTKFSVKYADGGGGGGRGYPSYSELDSSDTFPLFRFFSIVFLFPKYFHYN